MSSSSPRRLVKRSELVIMAMFLMNPGSVSLSGSDMAPAAPAPGGGGRKGRGCGAAVGGSRRAPKLLRRDGNKTQLSYGTRIKRTPAEEQGGQICAAANARTDMHWRVHSRRARAMQKSPEPRGAAPPGRLRASGGQLAPRQSEQGGGEQAKHREPPCSGGPKAETPPDPNFSARTKCAYLRAPILGSRDCYVEVVHLPRLA